MTIDFAHARSAHLSWKGRLLGYLAGDVELDEAKAISARRCDVGMWLYGSALNGDAANPKLRQLERVHAALHAAVGRTIQAKQAHQMAKAESDLELVRRLSLEVVSLLTDLETDLETENTSEV